ncbi:unnamed protein product, partial [Ectocarpus fasciculatus]
RVPCSRTLDEEGRMLHAHDSPRRDSRVEAINPCQPLIGLHRVHVWSIHTPLYAYFFAVCVRWADHALVPCLRAYKHKSILTLNTLVAEKTDDWPRLPSVQQATAVVAK